MLTVYVVHLILGACLPLYGQSPIFYVTADSPNDPGAGTLEDPYRHIQDGIDAAVVGIEIHVARGQYKESITMKDGVDLYGGYDSANWTAPSDPNANESIIDAKGLYTNVVRIIDANVTIHGFTITNGRATTGGGIYCAGSPTIVRCIITRNVAISQGGGMYNDANSSPVVIRTTFLGNSAFAGGAVSGKEANSTFTKCAFDDNVADMMGGAVYDEDGRLEFVDCTFTGNSAAWFAGGGIYSGQGELVLVDCEFTDNSTADSAGGIYCKGSRTSVRNCIFTRNSAAGQEEDSGYGGGIRSDDGELLVTTSRFTANSAKVGGAVCSMVNTAAFEHCIFTANSAKSGGPVCNGENTAAFKHCIFIANDGTDYGGGISFLYSTGDLTNCDFTLNSATRGKAVACYYEDYPSDVTFSNCILWDGPGEISNDNDSTIALSYSNVYGD